MIPEGWKETTVGKAYQICNNLRLPINVEERREMKGLYRYYGPTGVLDFINEYRLDGEYALIGEDGDHFLKYDERPMTLLVRGQFNVNNHAHIISGTANCQTSWFYYYFMHRPLTSYLTRQGAGRYKLNKATLEKIPVLIPPISEQCKIAEILSSWDKAIALLEQLITAKRKLKQGLMQQLLTGKKRFKEFEGSEWHIGMLNELGKSQFPTVKAGPFGSSVKKEFYTNQGYKIYGQEQVIANSPFIGEYYIDEARFQTLKSCEVLPNDILVSLVGTIGRVLLIPDNAEIGIINPRLLRIRLNQKKVLPLFAKYFLESEAILKLMNNLAQGGTMGVLNANLVKTVPFPILRIEEQQKIASILSAADTEISNLEKQLAAYKKQKRGLMQQLLTGKKRVKLDEPQMQKV
ncbi:restriction endonuclease subunit S [Nostoc commune]|uniref:restriction endonuclease subunit S n=1 Tax=Nostoc commune TaxID=1178 RepID=UPI0018C7D50E|nr:restriction endonuclease subunit S [Nostoc commune]MBG1259629.1 restriction endonuclease subunit S [Nostoc commune BAE]